jgi:hypothetical protein
VAHAYGEVLSETVWLRRKNRTRVAKDGIFYLFHGSKKLIIENKLSKVEREGSID